MAPNHPAAALAIAAALTAGPTVAAPAPATLNLDPPAAKMALWTHLPRQRILAIMPDVGLVLLQPGVRDAAKGVVQGTEVQGEVMDDDLAAERGWRSLRLRLDIACPDRKTLIRQFDAYADHDLKGQVQKVQPPAGWIRPDVGAFLNPVIDKACGELKAASPSPLPAPTPPVTLIAVTAPEPKPPAPPPSAPTAIPAVAPSAPRATIPAAAPPASPGLFTVQVKAAPTAAEAQKALQDLAGIPHLSLAELTPHVEPAVVHGRTVYRALISGLATPGDAGAFCQAVREAGGACFMRAERKSQGANEQIALSEWARAALRPRQEELDAPKGSGDQ